jgi:hypothetical protein
MVGLIVLISLCLLAGLVIFAKYSDCDPIAMEVRTMTMTMCHFILILDSLRQSGYTGLNPVYANRKSPHQTNSFHSS